MSEEKCKYAPGEYTLGRSLSEMAEEETTHRVEERLKELTDEKIAEFIQRAQDAERNIKRVHELESENINLRSKARAVAEHIAACPPGYGLQISCPSGTCKECWMKFFYGEGVSPMREVAKFLEGMTPNEFSQLVYEAEKRGLVTRKEPKAQVSRVPIIRTDPELPLPSRAHEHDAGFDLPAYFGGLLQPGETGVIRTNCHMLIPKGHFGQVCGRSHLSKLGLLVHHGTIDSGFTGQICVVATNLSRRPIEWLAGDRMAQIILIPHLVCEPEEVRQLPITERGAKGFGSSGR